MRLVRFVKRLLSCKTPPCSACWNSIEEPPELNKRVLVKSKSGEVNIAHLDPEEENLWVTFAIEISGKLFKFKVLEPDSWKEIPQ